MLAVAWTLALLPWSARSARRLLGAWCLGLAVIAVVSLVGAFGTDELRTYLFEARYQDPVGYPNGNAALALIGMLPALALASDRYAHPLVAGCFLAVAALLADFALLSQSRGSFVGLAVALPIMIALAPDRLRLVIMVLVLAGAVALAAGPILDVVDVGDAHRPSARRSTTRWRRYRCRSSSRGSRRRCCRPASARRARAEPCSGRVAGWRSPAWR